MITHRVTCPFALLVQLYMYGFHVISRLYTSYNYQKIIHLMPFQEVQLCVILEHGLLAARLW